jgi:hypothetical protein
MEIRVNQEAKQKRLDNTIQEIIFRAKSVASRGIGQFTYEIPEGVSAYQVSEGVLKETNNTVYVPGRGISGLQITFCIKE